MWIFVSDINECDDNNGGCVGGSCQNLQGSYVCQCGTGYALYESKEFQGFNKPTSETGEMPGDVYRFNHTCVREYSPSICMELSMGSELAMLWYSICFLRHRSCYIIV